MDELLRNWTGEKIGTLPYFDSTETNFRRLFTQVNATNTSGGIYIRSLNRNTSIHFPFERLSLRCSVGNAEWTAFDITRFVLNKLLYTMNFDIEKRCINALMDFSEDPEEPRDGLISVTDCHVFTELNHRRRERIFHLSCYLMVGVY